MNWVADLLAAVPQSLAVWAGSIVLGAVLGVFVAAARMSRHGLVRGLSAGYIEVFRGVPTLVWLFIVFFGLTSFGFNPTALSSAILTLGAVTAAYTAEIYRSGLGAVPHQQREGATALGLPPRIVLAKVLIPQARPIIFAGLGSFGIHLLKETALASLIGVVEVMNVANYLVERGANGLEVFLVAGLVYIVLCLPIAAASAVLGRAVRAKKATTRKAA